MPALDSLFEALKLDHLAAQCDALLEQAAKKDLGYRELLTQALTCEWQGRKQKGAEARLAQARLPWLKTLEQFDFSFQPSIDRKVVRELSTLGRGAKTIRRAGGKRRAARTAGRWQNAYRGLESTWLSCIAPSTNGGDDTSETNRCHQGRPGGPPGAVSDP